jgi:hypothetical protein
MTKNLLFRIGAFALLFSLLASCTAQKRFQRRLIGTWNVERYEQLYPSGQREVSPNVGSVTFRRNGGGENDLPVLTRNLRMPDVGNFSWKNTTEEVTIISGNTYLAKSWIVMRNRRTHQIWKSTTQAVVQTMELRKMR